VANLLVISKKIAAKRREYNENISVLQLYSVSISNASVFADYMFT